MKVLLVIVGVVFVAGVSFCGTDAAWIQLERNQNGVPVLGRTNKEQYFQNNEPTNGWEILSELINCVNDKLESLEKIISQLVNFAPVKLGKAYPGNPDGGLIATGRSGGSGIGGLSPTSFKDILKGVVGGLSGRQTDQNMADTFTSPDF